MVKYRVIKNNILIFTILLSAAAFLTSCDKAKEAADNTSKAVTETAEKASDMAEKSADKVSEATDSVVSKSSDAVEAVKEKAAEVVESKQFMGVWTGKFDSRETALTFTNENGNEVEGKISISYRNPINQEVKGTYNPDTRTLTLADQLHSRSMGKYVGKISEDGKTYTGTFTTNVDKKTVSFKLNKK